MIPFDFEYHRPDTAVEAVQRFTSLQAEGKRPLYYGGGTEIITMARLHQLSTGAVVDIKAIPECTALGQSGGEAVFGAGCNLAEIGEADAWPFLTDAAGRVADHTARCKITLGGNLAAAIPYREAALPLLLADAEAVVAGPAGTRRAPFAEVFRRRLRLGEGEFLVQVRVRREDTELPHFCVKRTRLDWVDYPLVTVGALRKDGRIRVAFSGLCAEPFRALEMEAALNAEGPAEARVEEAVARIPDPVVDDLHGSADFRRFILRRTLADMLGALA